MPCHYSRSKYISATCKTPEWWQNYFIHAKNHHFQSSSVVKACLNEKKSCAISLLSTVSRRLSPSSSTLLLRKCNDLSVQWQWHKTQVFPIKMYSAKMVQQLRSWKLNLSRMLFAICVLDCFPSPGSCGELHSWSLSLPSYPSAIQYQMIRNGKTIKRGCNEAIHLAKTHGVTRGQTVSKHIQHRRSCRWSWLFLVSQSWKYLEVPPFEVQELRAPDVMPDEDILILTKTEMLKPSRNLLRSPEVNC